MPRGNVQDIAIGWATLLQLAQNTCMCADINGEAAVLVAGGVLQAPPTNLEIESVAQGVGKR